VVPVYLPPPRERRQDIPALVRFFLKLLREEMLCPRCRNQSSAAAELLLAPATSASWKNPVERAVVLSHNQPINWDVMTMPGQERRLRSSGKPGDLPGMIRELVRAALQRMPADEGRLHDRLVGGVENELLEQVLPLCDNVLIKAAARLGINRNTLHKKLAELRQSPAKDRDGVVDMWGLCPLRLAARRTCHPTNFIDDRRGA
jgi:Nif-specific regulatory protein